MGATHTHHHHHYPPPSPPPPPPPSPTFSEPWRTMPWGRNQENLQYVRDYKTESNDVTHLRILLYGPVGVGKSSFINTIAGTIRGELSHKAESSSIVSETSFTKQYETHKIRTGPQRSSPLCSFVFNDVMGLELDSGSGVHPEDFKLALKGHVKDKHKFNPVSPLSTGDDGYNQNPSLDDRVHVLVCVLSANHTQIDSSVLQKMTNIREAASELGIPQMAIITKIDEACGETQKDLKNVYKSKHLKKKMQDFSTEVGIPMNCIFPMKNYCEEASINPDVDTLVLSALRSIISAGDEFIDKIIDE